MSKVKDVVLNALKFVGKKLIEVGLPWLKKMADEKIIPATITGSYELIMRTVQLGIDKWYELCEKASKEDNATKRAAHIVGLKLGLGIFKTIAEGLNNFVASADEAVTALEGK